MLRAVHAPSDTCPACGTPEVAPREGARLNGRERRVLELLERGMNVAQAARNLGVEAATVDEHRRRALAKLRDLPYGAAR